ncbi:hypothetical protein Q5H91_06270 [Sphingomonas sp. KR1UV-12]|uniref:Uncharacterized protein n=1 Tax=Sphingomonas aurea TaxID=3063994 RepID=A0ABT9EIS2_9SPHN|nr:hypothetical protein [Sphingomonas sp. KR1UV-12]MDP1026809.1 hypothetical protein [Sphingomonas sp. KR1UV-12]
MSAILLLAIALQATPAAAPPAKPVADRRVCKTFASTGSRLGGKRVCKTAREWDEEEVDAHREVDNMRNNAFKAYATSQ